MKLETFFAKFDQFADAPDAVAKMRELVRHLAVTGKLVGQDPSAESGELLLKKINAERLAAVKARQISPMKPLPAVGDEELLFELQPGWAPARLIELVMEIQTGPFGSSLHKSDYQLGGTPVINPASLKDGKIVAIDEMAIGHATLKRLEVFKLNAGDIVMARRGEMGRCAIVTKNEAGWLCGTGSLVLRMPRSLFAPFLAMLIGAPLARTYLGGASVGTTMQNLNQSILAKMPVGVPPLAEQKRIVAKVDALMALCDRLEAEQLARETRHAALARASLARFADAPTPANLPFLLHPSYAIPPADLRKSILTLAVQGKLVPQEPNDEPGEQILRRIHSGTSSKKTANGSMASDDLGELPFGLPNGWSVSRLGSILLPTRGISYGVIKLGPEPQQGGVFILRCSNVRFRRIDLNGIRKVTEQLSSEYGRTILEGGEVLINVRGTLGGCAVVPRALKGYNIAREVAVIPVHSEIDPTFLLNVIASPYFQDRVDENLRGIAYEGLNLGLLRDFLVPIPPLAEQRRIVAKVEQLISLVDALETQLATTGATAANLLSALVAELTVA